MVWGGYYYPPTPTPTHQPNISYTLISVDHIHKMPRAVMDAMAEQVRGWVGLSKKPIVLVHV